MSAVQKIPSNTSAGASKPTTNCLGTCTVRSTVDDSPTAGVASRFERWAGDQREQRDADDGEAPSPAAIARRDVRSGREHPRRLGGDHQRAVVVGEQQQRRGDRPPHERAAVAAVDVADEEVEADRREQDHERVRAGLLGEPDEERVDREHGGRDERGAAVDEPHRGRRGDRDR